MADAKRDNNRVTTLLAVSNVDGITPVVLWADPTTHELLVDDVSSGTVTSVSVVTANGVSGSVATATTTPAITLTLGAITPTSVNGLTFTALATGFSVAGGTTSKTLTISNTLTFAGTDATTMTFPATSQTVAGLGVNQTFTTGQIITVADTINKVGLTINQNDTTNNPNAMNIVNAGTGNGLYINQTGVLASGKYGLYVYSDTAQTTGWLTQIKQDNASSTQYPLVVINDGTGVGMYIGQNGAASAFQIANTSTQQSAYIARTGIGASGRHSVHIIDSNASTVGRGLEIEYAGTGEALQIDGTGTGGGIHVLQTGNLATSKHGLLVSSSIAQTDTNTSLVVFGVTNASAVNFPVLLVQQASESNAIWIEQTGAGRAFVIANTSYGVAQAIDQDVTNTNWTLGCFDIVATSVVNNAGTYTKSGNIVSILSNVTETSGVITDTAIVLNLQQTHAQASGAVLSISNSGTGTDITAPNFTLTNGAVVATSLALGVGSITMSGSIGVTGTRVTKGWFTDLEVTNDIVGDITGNAATVTSFSPAGGSLTLAGADALTLTTSAATNVTLPTTGTLATLAGAETLSTKLILVTAAPGSDHLASGTIIALTANENQAFGDVCYINVDGQAQLADATVIATASAVVMCADASINADASGNYLLYGIARDDTWAWTVGGLIYLSLTGTTGNTLTQTAPTATDEVIQILGVATHADRMLFNPNLAQVEHT